MASSPRSRDDLDAQWNLHSSRQSEASKDAIAAITLLNSGSWLALLTQIDKLAKTGTPDHAAFVLIAWGAGAVFGTLPWFCIYLNTLLLWSHDIHRTRRRYQWGINATIILGCIFALSSLACFIWGLHAARLIVLQGG